MAVISIQAVQATTVSGLNARITGINPTSTDFLVGEVDTPTGVQGAHWDKSGLARDNDGSFNIRYDTDDLEDLLETALNQLTPAVLQMIR